MRHKYATRAIVLSRFSLGEANTLVSLLTEEFGVIRARAQGLRKSGAKLASALQTFSACRIILVRGAEAWRLSGAVLETAWFRELSKAARVRAARVAALITRLVHGEDADPALFTVFEQYLIALHTFPEERYDIAECLAALRVLHVLGHDAGDVPGGTDGFTDEVLIDASARRSVLIARVNHGLKASGL